MSKSPPPYVRPHAEVLAGRLVEPRRFIQVVTGARQVGKTTLVLQVTRDERFTAHFASADEPALRGGGWIEQQWQAARLRLQEGRRIPVLVLDEIQKIPGWSETVKRLWDEDTRIGTNLRLVLLGSGPLLVSQGLGDSLTGRFETIHLPHWPYAEMREAFGFTLDEFLVFGGYPGAGPLIGDSQRWSRYVLDALIEPTISRDVLLLTRVDKPALLRRLFDLATGYSGQILSFNKMVGQLQDAGNATTLAHYLHLLAGAGMVTGLQKYAGDLARRRASSPKLQVYNTALITASIGLSPEEALATGAARGRLIESAVGAHLVNAAAGGDCEVFYWREGNAEVDFVARSGRKVTAIEVKSGAGRMVVPGIEAFRKAFSPDRSLLVGGDGIPLDEFLLRPVTDWIA